MKLLNVFRSQVAGKFHTYWFKYALGYIIHGREIVLDWQEVKNIALISK